MPGEGKPVYEGVHFSWEKYIARFLGIKDVAPVPVKKNPPKRGFHFERTGTRINVPDPRTPPPGKHTIVIEAED